MKVTTRTQTKTFLSTTAFSKKPGVALSTCYPNTWEVKDHKFKASHAIKKL